MKISVTNFVKLHNKEIDNKKKIDNEFFIKHKETIKIIQHERLIHLIVTMFTMLFDILFLLLFYISNEIAFLIIFIILLIVSVFYFAHYFFLENTLIKWYFINNKG